MIDMVGTTSGANWPPEFTADFTSKVWLTYRSHFTPIRDTNLADLPLPSIFWKKWGWGLPGLGGERGWTSDSGWGCMLRTGQSLLANALVFMWLGREWRRPPAPMPTESYASVHRMALAGKELGKDVGQWFGPSTAAGAIKTL
ncbi:hypothetical protein MPER_06700, partial [Moniliophthora perniciosa FA553]